MKFIVAVDKEWGIGNKGDLLARVKADLLHFRGLTKGKTVVYGSNTLKTFPGGKPLPDRKNIVLNWDTSFQPEGVKVVHSLDMLWEELKKHRADEVFVIGGASVYRQLIPFCDYGYVTVFEKSFEKDVFIPNLDEDPGWERVYDGKPLMTDEKTDTVSGMAYRFTEYRRNYPQQAEMEK